MGLRTRGRRNRILVNLDVSAPTTERFYFMGFINFIAELLKDPRTAIASWIAAGPLMAYGCVFLIIFIETGVMAFTLPEAMILRPKKWPIIKLH